MMPFDFLFPDIARSEARAFGGAPGSPLGAGPFVFREFYCAEPRCDCRRVLLQIASAAESGRVVATINRAFEPPDDEPQTFLDPINPQSERSELFLEAFLDMIATDPTFEEALVRHYTMFKRVVEDPSHPDHGKVRTEEHDDPLFRPAFPKRAKVGRNDPCHCGSGKKFKKCCIDA